MPMILVLAFQAAAAPGPVPAPGLAAIDFDLARYSRIELGLGSDACRRDNSSDIVVCARRGAGAYPLAAMARIFEPHLLVAERRLTGNLMGDVHVEQADLPPDRGAVANRVMIGLRLPF